MVDGVIASSGELLPISHPLGASSAGPSQVSIHGLVLQLPAELLGMRPYSSPRNALCPNRNGGFKWFPPRNDGFWMVLPQGMIIDGWDYPALDFTNQNIGELNVEKVIGLYHCLPNGDHAGHRFKAVPPTD